MPRRLLLLLLTLASSSCLEQCAPGRVGKGVGRLTVRNLGAILQLVNSDTVCGFGSEAVKQRFTMEGEPGTLGSVTWSIEGCEIDLSTAPKISTDCNQETDTISGRIVVSARRTVAGTLTGNADLPVVPISPEAVTIELLDVELFDFTVQTSASENVLQMKSGHLSAIAKPRLAASKSGICQVATPNIEISKIQYRDAELHVMAEGRSFDVNVPISDLTAVNGLHGERENWIAGTIKPFGKTARYATEGEHLDPDYEREFFASAFSCNEELAMPLSYDCGDIGPILAQGIARLTIRNLGAITSFIEEDTGCGFSSEAVLAGVQLGASPGSIGEARFRVESCTVTFPPETVLKRNCRGEPTMISGSVTITATKIMNGRLTGNLEQPVVPVNDHPARFELERILFDDFEVKEDGKSLQLISGAMSARVESRTAMDTELTACGFKTPRARMSEISYLEPTRAKLSAAQGTFETMIDGASLRAVNGTWGDESNLLEGSIIIDGESHTVPVNEADPGLNPDFDQARFDESWQCGNVDRENPFECRFGAPLAQGAAQLSAITLGTIANLLDADATCGFASEAVRSAVAIQGELGDPGGSATFAITQPCELVFPEPTVLREDCNGKKTFGRGIARVTGTKTLHGYVSGDPLQPIVPNSWEPAEIAIGIDFEEFSIWTEPGTNQLDVHAGRLAGTLRPRTAIDRESGACSLGTPVVAIDKITWTEGALTITSNDRIFDVAVSTSNLSAVNGNRDGVENSLTGSVVLDGETYAIPIRSGLGLDPDYDPARFLSSFACTPNLELPVSEADCDLSGLLGGGVARLLISALGTVAGLANSDRFRCGFGAIGTLTDPIRVEGEPGDMGEMEWRIEGCDIAFDPADGPFATDCLDTDAHLHGLASVTGNRVVEGLREELDILIFSIDSIVPTHRRAVTVTFDEIRFEELAVYELHPNQSVPDRRIQIANGIMSAVVEPVTGENNGQGGGIPPPTEGAFDVPTKVARMRDVHLGDADVTILYQGKTFRVHVDRADLYAFNGSWADAGETNVISGEISVNGRVVRLEPQPLVPSYDQADFDARYACTESLVATIPP
jgi:hypothetical protein